LPVYVLKLNLKDLRPTPTSYSALATLRTYFKLQVCMPLALFIIRTVYRTVNSNVSWAKTMCLTIAV